MKQKFKKKLYFFVASYFKALAAKKLARWHPIIIVITGSTGKTTLLNLFESQLESRARYSHDANSSYGVPFDILGLKRTTLKPIEWIGLFLSAPFKALFRIPKEKIYIVEADCDRPGEGEFLASLLNPEVTVWQNISRTHSVNFDKLLENKKFKTIEDAIAYEFGYFIEQTKKLVIVNADSEFIKKQLMRTIAKVEKISSSVLDSYTVDTNSTKFTISGKEYVFPVLLPQNSFLAVAATLRVLKYLNITPTESFSNFRIPPGRSSVFQGIKNTTIIDSSYNASLSSMDAILGLFEKYPGKKKWIILGDMVELGHEAQEEHEKLASIILRTKYDKIILVGPRLAKYTYPILKQHGLGKRYLEHFMRPAEALEYLTENIHGREILLFKGARFLEGIIEYLLQNSEDIEKLPRREKVWEERRKQWDL